MPKSVPITRGFVVRGALDHFDACGGDVAALCTLARLPDPSELDSNAIIPAERYYDAVNKMVQLSGDRYFAARAGVSIARRGLPALVEAKTLSASFAEFLIRTQIIFRTAVTNARYELRTNGELAVFGLARDVRPRISVANVDALNAAGFITLINDNVGGRTLSQMTVALIDPDALPEEVIPRSSIVRTAGNPMQLTFPVEWLLTKMTGDWAVQSETPTQSDGASFLISAKKIMLDAVIKQLRDGPVSLSRVAEDLGVSERRLQRSLSAHGTGFRAMLTDAKLAFACDLLENTEETIADIAQRSGFSSPAALTKSMREYRGETPANFRKTIRDEY